VNRLGKDTCPAISQQLKLNIHGFSTTEMIFKHVHILPEKCFFKYKPIWKGFRSLLYNLQEYTISGTTVSSTQMFPSPNNGRKFMIL
jgi:hypothetical protein